MRISALKWVALAAPLLFLGTCGIRSCSAQPTSELVINEPVVIVEEEKLDGAREETPVVEEAIIVEEVPIVVVVVPTENEPIKHIPVIEEVVEETPYVEVVEETIVEEIVIEETIKPVEVVGVLVIEKVVVIEVPYVEDVVTMSCPDEDERVALLGVTTAVGAFNDSEDDGTIVYAIPAVSLSVFETDGFGFGGLGYMGFGLEETHSFIASGIMGASYGKPMNCFTLSATGGLYGVLMQYTRDDQLNTLNSLGLGGAIHVMFPFEDSDHSWSVSLGIASGFIGDPNGVITLGFSIR